MHIIPVTADINSRASCADCCCLLWYLLRLLLSPLPSPPLPGTTSRSPLAPQAVQSAKQPLVELEVQGAGAYAQLEGVDAFAKQVSLGSQQ